MLLHNSTSTFSSQVKIDCKWFESSQNTGIFLESTCQTHRACCNELYRWQVEQRLAHINQTGIRSNIGSRVMEDYLGKFKQNLINRLRVRRHKSIRQYYPTPITSTLAWFVLDNQIYHKNHLNATSTTYSYIWGKNISQTPHKKNQHLLGAGLH